jgi:Ferredoxin
VNRYTVKSLNELDWPCPSNDLTRQRPVAVARRRVNTDIELRREHFFLTFSLTFTGKTMADAANKYAENVAGKFYVDDQCIDCDLCRETAPANFKRNDDGGHSYVYKQPESPEEEALCKEAMEGCPVEAIGNDGA